MAEWWRARDWAAVVAAVLLLMLAPGTARAGQERDEGEVQPQADPPAAYLPLLLLNAGQPAPVAGDRIAFDSTRDVANAIFVMNADGSGLARLTDGLTDDWAPAWSPDGKRIAFESYRDGNDEIYVMNVDGSGLMRLTNDEAWDSAPAWRP